MKKNIIIGIILSALFLLAAGIIYLNNFYLPVRIKSQVINTIQSSFNLNAQIEKVKYSFTRGLIIQDISLYDKVNDEENTFLKIREIYFNFLFIPIFKEGKIIVPVIHVDSPYLYIRRNPDNSFNFSKIFSPKSQAPQKSKFSFLIHKVNIFNGRCAFKDEYIKPALRKELEDLHMGLTISPLANISVLFKAKLASGTEKSARIALRGEYKLTSQAFHSTVNISNLSIPQFEAYLKTLPISIESAHIEEAEFDLSFRDKIISLQGVMPLKNISLRKENYLFTGDVEAKPALKYALEKKEFDYQAGLKFLRAKLEGIPKIGKIDNITGDVILTKDKVNTENLQIAVLDSELLLKGILENFTDPRIDIILSSEKAKLENIASLFILPKELLLSGVAKLNIDIAGKINKPPLYIKAGLGIRDTKLKIGLLKEPLENISGKLTLTPDEAIWEDLSFNYKGITYASGGKLKNFKEPRLDFNLSSSELDLKSDLRVKEKVIRVTAFEGKYLNSKFDIKGDVEIEDNANPLLDLRAKINLNLGDTLKFLPEKTKEAMEKARPAGRLNILGSVKGNVKDYPGLKFIFKANSESISLYNLGFQKVTFNAKQQNKFLTVSPFNASFYSGTVNMEFKSDLNAPAGDYTLKLNTSGINLAQLKKDTNFKDKDITGIVNLDAQLFGNFKDTSALKGEAAVSVREGKLWEIGLLKGLGDLVFIPEYEKIVFKEASGDFGIENKSLITETLEFNSEPLKLHCKGKAGFDGALDFTVYNEVNKDLIKESPDIRKFPAAILGEISSSIVVKVSGTIQKPKYDVVPMPLDILKNIKDFFLGKE